MVALVLLCAASVASPGPNFALVSRTALAVSSRAAIGAAFGIAAGATVYMCLAMFGASAAIGRMPGSHEAVRAVGGFILVYLAYRIYAAHPSEEGSRALTGEEGVRHGFPYGLVTSLSNPQPFLFFLGAFASSEVLRATLTTQLAAIFACACIEVVWYGLVALLLSRGGPRTFYQRYRHAFDLAFCLVLAVLGLFAVYEGVGRVLAGYGGAP